MKVTINDIAKRLGIHPSTVSLALNNSPKISETTREKVIKTAADMGYRCNPYVAALMSSIRCGKVPENPPTIAFITSSETPEGWRESYNFSKFYESCMNVAQNLGIRLETFWIGDEALSTKRLDDILFNRGIRGGIFLPTGQFREKMNHDWSRIAAVSYGIYDIVPGVDRVKADHYGNMEKVLDIIAGHKFRRIGFVMETPYPYGNHNRWLAAYLMKCRLSQPGHLVSPMLDPAPSFSTFSSWFKHAEPDLVICVNASKVDPWIKQLGLDIPKDVSLVTVSNARDDGLYSGMAENSTDCGKLAMENLLDRIHQNQIGTPDAPRCITVRGRWVPGKTIRLLEENQMGL